MANPVTPVVEVARNQQRRVGRHFAFDKAPEPGHLAQPAGRYQAQVHHQHMNRAPVHGDFAVQQTALLQPVIRNIFMLVCRHRPA